MDFASISNLFLLWGKEMYGFYDLVADAKPNALTFFLLIFFSFIFQMITYSSACWSKFWLPLSLKNNNSNSNFIYVLFRMVIWLVCTFIQSSKILQLPVNVHVCQILIRGSYFTVFLISLNRQDDHKICNTLQGHVT